MPPAAPVTRTVCMKNPRDWRNSGRRGCGRRTIADLGDELLVALAAVDEVASHRGARRSRRAGTDGIEDFHVLVLDALEVSALILERRESLADALARNDETAEIVEKTLELRIAGGLGDAAMERKVLVDCRLAAPDGILDAPESLGDPFDVRAIVALGGEPRRFDLDASAQLHHVERLAQRIQLIDFDSERPAHMFGDEGADALP